MSLLQGVGWNSLQTSSGNIRSDKLQCNGQCLKLKESFTMLRWVQKHSKLHTLVSTRFHQWLPRRVEAESSRFTDTVESALSSHLVKYSRRLVSLVVFYVRFVGKVAFRAANSRLRDAGYKENFAAGLLTAILLGLFMHGKTFYFIL